MLEIIDFGNQLTEFWRDMAEFVNRPILDFEGFTVTFAGLFVGGLVFAILAYKIVKFLIP